MTSEENQKSLLPSNLEISIREALENDIEINWEAFLTLEFNPKDDKTIYQYQKLIDLLLKYEIFSLEQDGNIVLRVADATSDKNIANPRHYEIKNAVSGNSPLFFTRDKDALRYIEAGKETNRLSQNYQAQRVHVIK